LWATAVGGDPYGVVLEFKFSLRSNATVRFKGKWLRSSSISDAALAVLRIFVVNACGAPPAQNGEFVNS